MSGLKTIFREVFGLFVEDGSLAIAILIWLGLVWLLRARLEAVSEWGGWILFAGLGLILVESALRFARNR